MDVEVININYKKSKRDIEKVWRSCNWGWNDNNLERMESIFKNRWRNYIAYTKTDPVGYVGLISDHNVYALGVDMMVEPTLQKKGIGKALMNKIISDCKSEGIKVIKLISSEKGKNLYTNSGFNICPVESPGMMLKLYEL